MAAITFPSNPSNGDIFTVGTQSWRWNSSVPAWEAAPQSANLTASGVANVPAGNIAATTVQAAIDELDAEKFPYSGGTVTGAMTVSGQLSASATQNIAGGEAVMTRTLSDGRYATRLSVKTGAFTAVAYARYAASGTFAVADPASAALNDLYEVFVLSGSVTVGGVAYAPSRMSVVRRCSNATGPVWETLSATVSGDIEITDKTKGVIFKGSDDTRWRMTLGVTNGIPSPVFTAL